MDTRHTSRSTDPIDQRMSKMEENMLGMQQQHEESMLQMKNDLVLQLKTLLSDRPLPPPIDVDEPPFPGKGESSTRPTTGSATNRMLKVEMTRFDGTNPKGWLFKTERHFNYYDLTDEERFTMVSVNMEGAALSWFQAMFENQRLTTWSRFRASLLQRFGPSPYHDLKGELMKLHQHGTVQEYYDQFESLVNQVEGMQDDDLQSCFISGLRRDISRDVRVLQPHSIDHALHLAKMMEDRIADVSMTHFYSSSPPPQTRSHSSYFPPPRPPPNQPPSTTTKFPPLQLPPPTRTSLPQPNQPSATPPPYIPSFSRPPETRLCTWQGLAI